MAREIIYTIKADGSGVTAEVVGHQGPGCKKLTESTLRRLGVEEQATEKLEYYQPEQKVKEQQRLRQ